MSDALAMPGSADIEFESARVTIELRPVVVSECCGLGAKR